MLIHLATMIYNDCMMVTDGMTQYDDFAGLVQHLKDIISGQSFFCRMQNAFEAMAWILRPPLMLNKRILRAGCFGSSQPTLTAFAFERVHKSPIFSQDRNRIQNPAIHPSVYIAYTPTISKSYANTQVVLRALKVEIH